MFGLAAAARPAVALESRIPVAPKEMHRMALSPVTGPAQPDNHRRRLPAGAKQAQLASPPRLSAIGSAPAFLSEAVGAYGEARVTSIIGNKNRHTYLYRGVLA